MIEIPMKNLVRVLAYFLFFHAKVVLKAKNKKVVYLQLLINMTEEVYGSHHGFILILRN